VCVRCPINGRIHSDITYIYIGLHDHIIILSCESGGGGGAVYIGFLCGKTNILLFVAKQIDPVGKRYRRVYVGTYLYR